MIRKKKVFAVLMEGKSPMKIFSEKHCINFEFPGTHLSTKRNNLSQINYFSHFTRNDSSK